MGPSPTPRALRALPLHARDPIRARARARGAGASSRDRARGRARAVPARLGGAPVGRALGTMQGERYEGVIKSFRGSFGWVSCKDVAEKHSGRDIFLHKNALNSIPAIGATVAFILAFDAKGNPKAQDAVLLPGREKPTPPDTVAPQARPGGAAADASAVVATADAGACAGAAA